MNFLSVSRNLKEAPVGLYNVPNAPEVPGIYSQSVFASIEAVYNEVPPMPVIDPTKLPVVDKYLEKRGRPLRQLTKGRWLGMRKSTLPPTAKRLMSLARMTCWSGFACST